LWEDLDIFLKKCSNQPIEVLRSGWFRSKAKKHDLASPAYLRG
jgi:hypothetical protein